MSQDPIGLLDSGVGGLSVLRELLRQHPQENYLYFADQAHVRRAKLYYLRARSGKRARLTEKRD